MKYSLRKSFSSRRRTDAHDDEPVYPRVDALGCSNSNSNLVKPTETKGFLRRSRRYSSSPPPVSSATPAGKSKSKVSEARYSNHVDHDNDEDDDDDDPFSPSADSTNRIRPLDRLTNQIRKSFRNTLTRQRSRLESNNSNKRLIFTNSDENPSVVPFISPITTGLTSQMISPADAKPNETDTLKALPKRRKAPLAPSHMNQSMSVPNPTCATLNMTDRRDSSYVTPSKDLEKNAPTKKTLLNQSLRMRISRLLKKRHAKRQQIQNCIDEDSDHHNHDDLEEMNQKKLTLGQRFDTLRRSFQVGKRNSTSKGKGHLLLNE